MQVEGAVCAKAQMPLQKNHSLMCAQSQRFTHKSARPTGSAAVPLEPPRGCRCGDVSGTLRLSWGAQGCERGLRGPGGAASPRWLLPLPLYLSARATASGSVGGIMKQTAGAVSSFPALSVRSQLSPLFLCRV